MLCFLCRRFLRWLDRDHADWSHDERVPEWVEGADDALSSWWMHGVNSADLCSKEEEPERLVAAYDLLLANPVEGFREIRSLAEAGSVMAMVYLGWALESGHGSAADGREAEHWYTRASEAGSDEAMLRLGHRAYRQKDAARVEAILRPGIEKGLTPAMQYVALANLRFARKPESRRIARQLLETASARGDLLARLNLARLRALGWFGWRDVRPGLGAWKRAGGDLIAWMKAEHVRSNGATPAVISAPETANVALDRNGPKSIPIAAILFGSAASHP